MKKTAVISGVTGQDGSYLSELLLQKDYRVIGLYRRSSTNNFIRINHLIDTPDFLMEEFDLTDPTSICHIIKTYHPEEFYNLAAQSHVATSFKQPTTTLEINTIGVINILEAIRALSPETRFYQASTSEMFGSSFGICPTTNEKYQDETTEFLPQSPYGVSKLCSHRMAQIYRDAYGLFTASGILFNHESPRRGENFVTRKITKYIGQLMNKKTTESLKLGNLSANRDWGHAKDYIRAMYLMLQVDKPDDFVICTGVTRTVLEFVKESFEYVNLDYKKYVEIDSELYRPAEVDYLRGRNEKAKRIIQWQPEISFIDMVRDMVDYDLKDCSYAQKL